MKNKPKFKMNLQLFAGDTLFSLKEKLTTIGAELQKVNTDLVEKAANAAIPIDEVTALEERQTNLQKRFNLIKTQYDKMEAEQKASLQKSGITNARTDEARIIAAKAEYIRALVENRPISDEAREILNDSPTPLQAIPASTSTGQNFLPTTLDKNLIHEPFVKNPLRDKVGLTAIKGLELPKIAFELDDDAFINDGAAAKEIQLTGDKVTFGRFKFKVKVRISDTVLHGSDVDLVNFVENALRSGLAAKEKKLAFASNDTAQAAEKHMSYYAEDTNGTLIKTVTGSTLYEAITDAIADLQEDFRENAQVCMKYSDYVSILKDLANSSVPLYGKQPEEIIGKPVFFSDAATTPIIGDFSYYHINYDPETVYDSDKDVDKGEYIWVLTAWLDQQFKLRSAFRLAEVTEEVDEG